MREYTCPRPQPSCELTNVERDSVFTHDAIADDFQMQLAHSADDGLSARGSWCNSYGEIFLGQLAQRALQSLAVIASPRTDDHGDYWAVLGVRFVHGAA